MNLNIRDLRYLLTVAEELHFGRAADRLGMAQPQLSELIRRLEDMTRVRIFQRRPKVRLTPGGEILVDMARRMIGELERDVERARAVASGKVGAVRLGFSETAKLTELPMTLKAFSDRHPDVKLDLLEGTSAQLWDLLERRSLDIIVSREARHDARIVNSPILRTTLSLILPLGHPLRAYDEISLRQLEAEPFILPRRSTDPSYYDQILRSCQEGGLNPNVVQEADSPSLMFALVRAGFGLSFELTQARKFTIPGIEFRAIKENILDVVIWLSHAMDLGPSAERLRDFLFEAAAET